MLLNRVSRNSRLQSSGVFPIACKKVTRDSLKRYSTLKYKGQSTILRNSLILVGVTLSTVVYVKYSSKRHISFDTSSRLGESRKKDPVTLLSDDQINTKLRANQQSYLVDRGTGIYRYDIAQLPSNNPIEDNHSEQIIQLRSDDTVNGSKDLFTDNIDLYFFGIYDGHGGPYTSTKLSQSLIPYVVKNMIKNDLVSNNNNNIDKTIQDAFLKLDNDIVIQAFKNLLSDPTNKKFIQNIFPAISGSCALLSIYDSQSKNLKVAVTGDSRALLIGKQNGGAQEQWFVKSCSIDQTGDNLNEVKRIREEHPNEPNVITRGRILGSLQPSRAFGDYRYKLKEIDGQSLDSLPDYLKLYLRSQPRNFMTPPYVTAKPEITTTKIDENIKLMVIGSDGLFEFLTNEEIASLAIKWLEHNQGSIKDPKLPVVTDISDNVGDDSQRTAFRYRENRNKNDSNSLGYLMEDSNIATHLIRNALSAGGRKEFVSTLVSIPSPKSRKYRDDLTVTVVFFGEMNHGRNKGHDREIAGSDASAIKPET